MDQGVRTVAPVFRVKSGPHLGQSRESPASSSSFLTYAFVGSEARRARSRTWKERHHFWSFLADRSQRETRTAAAQLPFARTHLFYAQ